jgi:hypothetical protein
MVRMKLVKEAVEEGRIRVEHIGSKKMVADGFTKPLEGAEFTFFEQVSWGATQSKATVGHWGLGPFSVLSYPGSFHIFWGSWIFLESGRMQMNSI